MELTIFFTIKTINRPNLLSGSRTPAFALLMALIKLGLLPMDLSSMRGLSTSTVTIVSLITSSGIQITRNFGTSMRLRS